MAQVFETAMRGLMTGREMRREDRREGAQARARQLMTSGDRRGAVLELMGEGMFNEAASARDTLQNVDTAEARREAGAFINAGNYGAAAGPMLMTGNLEDGKRLQDDARNREVGAAFVADPRKAAELAAQGGDIASATQLQDWAARADEREREAALGRIRVMGPILYRAGTMPYEQRRPYIQSQLGLLAGAGLTQEQVAGFDPTDENIRGVTDTGLGLERALGSYSQRVVADEVRTYRTDPYGVERVGSEPVPVSRAEQREERQLDLREEDMRLTREQRERVNTMADVVAPLLQKYSLGQPLNERETEIVRNYLDRNQSGGWGAPAGPPGLPPGVGRPPSAQPSLTGSGAGAIHPDPRTVPGGDPFPGIREGEVVTQDGKSYRRQGNQMVQVG